MTIVFEILNGLFSNTMMLNARKNKVRAILKMKNAEEDLAG